MVRDRFSEFQERSKWNIQPSPGASSIRNPLHEISISHHAYETAYRSQQFLQHVNELRDSIDQLQRRIRDLQQHQAAVLSQSVVRPEEKKLLTASIDEIKRHTQSLRPRVRQIEADLRRDEAHAPIEMRTGAELRIRRNHCEMLKHRLNELLALFNQTQIEYKSRVSKRVKRQLELAGKPLSLSQVDQMLESKSVEVFYQQMMPASFAAQMVLDDATSRHNEILQLEQSIAELNEIFRDMYELVHSQNQIVDHIAKNVESANNFIRDARIQVTHAVTYKKSSQRKKYILVLVGICALTLIVALLMFFIIGASARL